MLINGIKEEMAIARKNRVTKIIEVNNRCNGLPRPFALMKLIVQSMTLIIAEMPNINDRVQNVMNFMKNKRFGCESRLMCADAVRGMKATPVNRAEAFEKVGPAKTALTLTEDLVTMREQVIGKGT